MAYSNRRDLAAFYMLLYLQPSPFVYLVNETQESNNPLLNRPTNNVKALYVISSRTGRGISKTRDLVKFFVKVESLLWSMSLQDEVVTWTARVYENDIVRLQEYPEIDGAERLHTSMDDSPRPLRLHFQLSYGVLKNQLMCRIMSLDVELSRMTLQ
jgi:hypothetical protein